MSMLCLNPRRVLNLTKALKITTTAVLWPNECWIIYIKMKQLC